MSRIAVTGGAGFIGSHLADALLAAGHEVLVIDNLSTGRRHQVHPAASFAEMDMMDGTLAEVLVQFRPDAVYHHAAQVSVAFSLADPLHDAKANILGVIGLLEACRTAGVRKCIYPSSAAVYGTPQVSPISEDHTVRPLSFYGISKHAPELYLAAYRELYGLDYTVLRYSNVYGGRQDARGEGGVVSVFAGKLLAGEKPVIYGTGEQTRDFIYVKDVVTANLAALHRGGGWVLNVSSNTSVSVNGLMRDMCALTAQHFDPAYAPTRPGDIPDSRLDNRAAMEALDWLPVYSLRDGLRETLQFYKDERTGQLGAG